MMHDTTAIDGSPLAPESLKMMDYLHTRAAELSAEGICERVRAAAAELEKTVAAIPEAKCRVRPISGKWTIAEVVDHISQTQIRGAEELRHLLAGRRPPLPPVYEAIRSGAGQWAPWNMLMSELHQANQAMVEVLESGRGIPIRADDPTVRTVMVALHKPEGGAPRPQIYFAELAWKEYALLQRLHLLDHRRQVKELLGAVDAMHA